MNRKTILKIVVDIGMTVMLLFLMTYERIGAAVHEWLGMAMFVLFIFHHFLNRKWIGYVLKGRYTLFRIWQTILVVGILLTMVGSMYSGVILSEYALSFLPIKGGRAFVREVHMISAYWGFVLMSLHLGLHWGMMIGIAKRFVKELPAIRKIVAIGRWLLRGIAVLIAGYGAYAFIQREIGRYMLLINHFAFFDFEEPLIFFLEDYIAVMVLFVWVSHYFSKWLMRIKKKEE